MKRAARAFVTIVALALGAGPADAVDVVASIRPVHGLVAAVMAGVGEPGLLQERNGSPHAVSLRPSQAGMLASADAVFWIGPDLETFLASALDALPEGARIVALADAPGVMRLPVREAFDTHDDHAADASAHEDVDDRGHAHGAMDGHVWLDPDNARAMIEEIAETLAKVDPANARQYRSNADAADAAIVALDAELGEMLEPVAGAPFVVFHDAYQHMESRYDLRAVGAIALNPEVPPGARRIRDLRAELAERGVSCVFAEPQFPSATIDVLTEGTPARVAVLDPLGAHVDPGPDHYADMMRDLARSVRACLDGADPA